MVEKIVLLVILLSALPIVLYQKMIMLFKQGCLLRGAAGSLSVS